MTFNKALASAIPVSICIVLATTCSAQILDLGGGNSSGSSDSTSAHRGFETYYLMKIYEYDGSYSHKLLTQEEYDALRNRIRYERQYSFKAHALARKAWESDETRSGSYPFPRPSERQVTRIGRYRSREEGEEKLGKIQEKELEKAGEDKDERAQERRDEWNKEWKKFSDRHIRNRNISRTKQNQLRQEFQAEFDKDWAKDMAREDRKLDAAMMFVKELDRVIAEAEKRAAEEKAKRESGNSGGGRNILGL